MAEVGASVSHGEENGDKALSHPCATWLDKRFEIPREFIP